MTRLANFMPPGGTIGPDLGPKIAAGIGKPIRDAGSNPTEGVVVDGPNISESDRSAIQSVIDAYVYDPTYGRNLEPYVVTVNGSAPLTWTNMPSALTGLAQTETKLPLHVASFARLTARVQTAGFAGAVLIAQFSLDGSSWVNGPQVPIGTTGLKVSGLVAIPSQFQTDVFVRIAGQGGNGTVDPSFGVVTMQFG